MKTHTVQTRKWLTTCLVALLTFCLVLAGVFFISPIKAEAWVGEQFIVNDINYIVLTEEEGNYTVRASRGARSMNGNIPSQVYNESTGFYYTVVEIGNFQDTDLLNNLVIPETVTKIESYAFSNTWISNVVINGNPEIGSYAFSMSDVQSVEINGAPTFGEYVFDRCEKLTTVKFNSVDTNSSIQISDYMFNSCSALLSVTLSNNITSIGSNAFVNCKALKTISSFPSSLVSIGSHAFGYCGSLKEISFSEGLETIGESAFAYSGLQGTLNLPNSLTTIGNSAFVNTKVTSVVIPKSVKTIGDYAFDGCSSMTEITVYSKDVVWGKESLPITNLKQVYAHAGSTTKNYIDQFAATIRIDFFPIAELSWDLNGGAASVDLPSGYYAVGGGITITDAMWEGITRTGYTMGNVTCNGSIVPNVNPRDGRYMPTTHTMTEDGLSFVVNWTAKEYIVTFDQNGGTGGSPTSATVTYGSTYRLSNPVAPTKEGYRFEGYYAEIEMQGGIGQRPQIRSIQLFNADMMPTQQVWNFDITRNITLKAKWTPVVTSITIPTEKQSQTYYLGAEFVPFTITANLGDGTTQDVEVTEEMLTNFSTDTMGTRTATITYEGKTASFTYTVTGYAYKVEHYLQKITFDGYEATPWHTETLYGVGTTNAVARSYEGFTAKTVEQVNISEDGTSVVKVYYDKNAPTLTTNKYDLDDDGNYDEVYELASEWDLKWFAHTVNNGAANINGVLLNDIYLTADHIPIGINYIRGYADSITKYPFSGIFDGQGYAVYNIYKRVVTNDSPGTALLGHSSSNGLFGLTQYATIRNVTVVGPYIHMDVANYITYNNVGGIAGEIIETVLENCHVKSGENEVAKGKGVISDGVGEVGYLEGQAKVVNSNFSTARIYVGGLVGKAAGNSVIKNCSTNFPGEKDFILRAYLINGIGGNLEGHERIGSFIGHAEYSVIENCYVERGRMMTTLNYGSYVGQIAGYLGYCEVRNCFIYSEPVGRINGKSTIIENIYSLRDSSVFEDFDDTNDTNYSGQLYKVILDDNSSISTATIQLKDGQSAPYGTTNLKEALNHGSANIDGAYSWAITESDTQFELVKPVLQGIAIPPEQTFAIGHYKPFEVTVTYAEGGQTIIYATTDMISGLDVNQLTQSPQTATVSYSLDGVTKTAQFTYTVVAGIEYTVNHYLLNVDSSVPSAWHETEVLLGFGETYAVPKEYLGFTVLEFEQQQIADDGSTVINVYYSRNTYKVTLVKNNFEITTPTETFNIVFGAQLPTDRTPTSVALGCIFMGYFEQDGGVGAQWFDSKMQPIKQIYDIPDNVTLYGYSVICENHQWGEYTYVDGTNHQRKCTLCNKREDASAHFGGTATCQSAAICDACGSEYGSLGTHNYDMDEFGYQTADGHAHICTVDGCDEHDTVIPHTPNVDAATEDTAKYCTVGGCGFVIEQQLNHVHNEGTAWEHDSEYHWHDCVANDGQVYSKAAHTYDNACDTDCNVCGATRTITHDYSKLEKNDTQHWYVCGVCGEEKANSREGHSGGTANCQTLANCSACGQDYGTYAEHSYDMETWGYNAGDGHAHTCTISGCGEYDTVEAHTPNIPAATEDEAQVCVDCGYRMAAALGHTHSSATSWTSNATHHWHACSGCSAHLDEEPHSYDTNDACDADCNVCGYERSVTHDFTGEWQKDADGHWHVCENECGATDTKVAHVSAGTATETDPEACSICGWEIAPALGHTTHTPETEWEKNETHHWHECTGCDGQELDKATHADSDNNGRCDTCDYAMSTVTVDPGTDPINPDTDPGTQPPVDNPPVGDNDGLGTGAIIGIVVASVAVVGGGGFAFFWFVIRKKRKI